MMWHETAPRARKTLRGVPGRTTLAPVNDPISRRLPHVLTRADLVAALVTTYAAALSVEEDEAQDRLGRALERPELLAEAYGAIADALRAAKGPRTTEDALVDKLSAGVQARRGRVRAAPAGPGLSAVLVRVNLELGLAPEPMRQTLATEKGRAILAAGWVALAGHVVKELLR
jgi:hypothetical protein